MTAIETALEAPTLTPLEQAEHLLNTMLGDLSTVEAQLESLRREQRMNVAQTGQNSRDISRIRAKDRAA